MPDFHISTEGFGDGLTVIHVHGFLDAHTFEEMEETINQLFGESRYKLVVDLSKVDYISSAGAGVFIGAIGTAKENGGNIILMSPTPNVKEVFDLLGLTQIFSFADNPEAAARCFA